MEIPGILSVSLLSALFLDVSFATQAMRLLMFCARYLDLLSFHFGPPIALSVKLFLLLSTLIAVVLLGHQKWSVWGVPVR